MRVERKRHGESGIKNDGAVLSNVIARHTREEKMIYKTKKHNKRKGKREKEDRADTTRDTTRAQKETQDAWD